MRKSRKYTETEKRQVLEEVKLIKNVLGALWILPESMVDFHKNKSRINTQTEQYKMAEEIRKEWTNDSQENVISKLHDFKELILLTGDNKEGDEEQSLPLFDKFSGASNILFQRPLTSNLAENSSSSSMVGKKVNLPQLGWNCFDIAVGLQDGITAHEGELTPQLVRNKFVEFALNNSNNEEFRKLLSQEIKAAFMVSETHAFQSHRYGLPNNMLSMFSDSTVLSRPFIQDIISKHARLHNALIRRGSQSVINRYQEEFDKCFEQEEIYKVYLKGYYQDQHDWFLTMNNAANSNDYHCIIDIAAKYLHKNINVYKKSSNNNLELMYSTRLQGVDAVVNIEYQNNNHFVNIDHLNSQEKFAGRKQP